MKVVRYEWEDKYFVTHLNKIVLTFDNFNSSNMFDKIEIKTSIDTNRNIDFAKLVSFNFIFSLKKSYLSLKENVDKNPLKLKSVNKKSLNSNILLNYKSDFSYINIVNYVYYVYLVNLFKSKNIDFSSNVGMVYNIKLAELNSILKIGHSYNILDIDPLVNMNFAKVINKNLLDFYIKNK